MFNPEALQGESSSVPKSQRGSSVIPGELGLLHRLGAATNVQRASPGKPGESTCLLCLRFPVEISTGMMHRVGKKLFLSHFDARPEDRVGRRELCTSPLSYCAVLKALHCIPEQSDCFTCSVSYCWLPWQVQPLASFCWLHSTHSVH